VVLLIEAEQSHNRARLYMSSFERQISKICFVWVGETEGVFNVDNLCFFAFFHIVVGGTSSNGKHFFDKSLVHHL